jgi:phage terminase large subunit GpA-like protein
MTTNNIFASAFLEALQPDKLYDLDEWQDEHIVLSQKGAAEPGRYRTDRVPFLREIAKCLSPTHPCQRIVFMKSAQVGASQLGFNWLGFIIATIPSPILMVQPTEKVAEKVSRQRIAPLIEETEILKKSATSRNAKDSSNTLLFKEFDTNAVLLMAGANSPSGLRSMPIRFLLLDECDGYPADVGGEGSAVELAEKRTTTYSSRKKVFLISTPTIKETSIIEAEYEATDKRRYYVPCPFPNCGAYQHLQWKQMQWEGSDPNTAKYKCEHCEQLIEEKNKTWMLENGIWQATAPGTGITIGFHINSLYSPVGWKSWPELVDEFLKCKGDRPRLKTFINTSLGETWDEDQGVKFGIKELRERLDIYPLSIAPKDVLIITAAVDVQDNRFEIFYWGWGRDEESWIISYQVIYGEPSKPEMWAKLAEVLDKPIEHEIAAPMLPAVVEIDSGGHFTHEVYQFTRENKAKKWLAIKGQSQKGKPAIGRPTSVDVNYKNQILKSGALLFPVGTDTVKDVLFERMKNNNAHGAGCVHISNEVSDDFLNQITSEKKIIKYINRQATSFWVLKKPGTRNEAWDGFVYCYSGLQYILNQYNRKTVWDTLASRLKLKDQKSGQSDSPKPIAQDSLPERKINPSRGGFVNSW